MTTAANGLRLSASAPALALADMKIEDILAGMSDDQRIALAATLVPSAAAKDGKPMDADAADANDDADEDDAGMTPEEKAKKKEKMAADEVTAEARGFAAATTRAAAVMSSEHFEGRAAQAVKLLGNAKLSADEITAMLADMPDGTGASMLDAIRSKNPDLGTGSDAHVGAPAAGANHGWAAIQASAAKRYGFTK